MSQPQAQPAGEINEPIIGQRARRLPLRVAGWAALPSGTRSVEIRCKGLPSVRAAISTGRPDVAEVSDLAETPISGWHGVLPVETLPATTRKIEIHATAFGLDGTELALDPVGVAIDRSRALMKWLKRGKINRTPIEPHHPGGQTVVVALHSLEFGGSELQTLRTFAPLRAWGVNVHVVSPIDGPLRARFEAYGVPVHILDEIPIDSRESFEKAQGNWGYYLRELQAGLVVGVTWASVGIVDYAIRAGIPTIWDLHEHVLLPEFASVVFRGRWGKIDPEILAWGAQAIANANLITVCSQSALKLISEMSPANVQVIHSGIDEADFPHPNPPGSDRGDAKASVGLSPELTTITCVGALSDTKGQASLLRAFAHCAKSRPDLHLVLVGDLGNGYRVGLEDYARRVGIENMITIAPVDPEPARWMRATDRYVCASSLENLPVTLFEATACGAPILAPDIGGIPEFITDEVTGLLFDPFDQEDFQNRLLDFVQSPPEKLAGYQSRAFERVSSEFQLHERAARFRAVLRSLIE